MRQRSLAALKVNADKYKNWYNADGLFIEEFTNKVGYEKHCRDVTAYAKSIGMKMTMGNPGTDVPRSYIGTVDVINITEGRGYMPISWLQYCVQCSASRGWHYQEDKRNFAYIRYDIPTLDTAFETESARWVGLLYIHTGNEIYRQVVHGASVLWHAGRDSGQVIRAGPRGPATFLIFQKPLGRFPSAILRLPSEALRR